MNKGYDIIGDIYNKYWKEITLFQFTNIEELVLPIIPQKARILDVCCGTGTIAAKLCERGFEVEGIDISEKVIEYAKVNAPDASFVVGDARSFSYKYPFDAVISTLDSFNLITDKNDLKKVFKNVIDVLKPDGVFYFDMRNEEGYTKHWNGSHLALIEQDGVVAYHCAYEASSRFGLTKCAYFTNNYNNTWNRKDVYLPHRCYLEEEIFQLLEEVGFKNIRVCRKKEDMYTEVIGRSHYLCTIS